MEAGEEAGSLASGQIPWEGQKRGWVSNSQCENHTYYPVVSGQGVGGWCLDQNFPLTPQWVCPLTTDHHPDMTNISKVSEALNLLNFN